MIGDFGIIMRYWEHIGKSVQEDLKVVCWVGSLSEAIYQGFTV